MPALTFKKSSKSYSLKVLKIKPKIVADISNVAGYYSIFPPKVENIKI